jgi:ABC-2 type transport system ATP-binding protein
MKKSKSALKSPARRKSLCYTKDMDIEVAGLSKTFGSGDKRVHALKDVSFRIPSGEIFGFVGANGAGKSTTMRIIMGVLAGDSGEVFLDGAKANSSTRKRIGYMPSERGLYAKMKVREQLLYFAELHGLSPAEAKTSTDKWLERLNITQYANKQLQTLSTGNQQRAQLAVSLVPNPDALVLDEPFSGLDPQAVKVMSAVIREQAQKGVAVLFSSHQLDLVDELSNQVGIIKSGEMVVQGTPDELREKAGAPKTITIPTPLVDIYSDLIADEEKGAHNA